MQWKTLKLMGAVLLFLPAALFAAQPFLDTWLAPEVGQGPISVFAADLNGDGRLDLASANYDGNSATVLIDNAFGGFYRTDYPIAGFPTGVKAADLDGDGDRDLSVSVNGYGGNNPVISVLKNNGDGSFANPVDYPVGKFPEGLQVADFDADGDLDLAVVNNHFQFNSISVLMNNGDGTFATRIDYPTGDVPGALAAADLDGDGDIDVMTANAGYPYTISILKNNGDGSFAPKVDYPGGWYPTGTSAIATDLDADGDVDLVVTNWNESAFSVFKNNGDGTFAPKVDYGSGLWGVGAGISAADLDGDGDKDLAMCNLELNAVVIFKNDGTGNFGSGVNFSSGQIPANTFPADMDADGDWDVVVANAQNRMLSVLVNDGTGSFMDGTDYPTGPGPSHLSAVDFSGDGFPDLTVNSCCNGAVSVLLNNGSGNFIPRVDYPTPGNSSATIAADLDGDGDKELISTSSQVIDSQTTVGYISTWPNSGNGTFGAREDYQTGADPLTAAAGDIDGDGDNDLAVGARPVSVHFNNGDGTFGTKVDYDTAGDSYWVAVLLTDLDGDGDLDLAYTRVNPPANGTVAILKNNGSGTFGDKQEYVTGVATYSILASDLDADGDLDITAANGGWEYPPTGNTVAVLKNNGDGTFAPKTDYPGGTSPIGIAAFDANLDQYTDLVVTDHFSNTLGVLLNKGDGTFHPKIDYGAGQGPGELAASDLDLDADVDLAVVDYLGHKVKILKNLGGVPPTPMLGDLNRDGNFTASDAVVMINCVFLAFGTCGLTYSDVNCDGGLSTTDAVLEMNKVFVGTPFPCGP